MHFSLPSNFKASSACPPHPPQLKYILAVFDTPFTLRALPSVFSTSHSAASRFRFLISYTARTPPAYNTFTSSPASQTTLRCLYFVQNTSDVEMTRHLYLQRVDRVFGGGGDPGCSVTSDEVCTVYVLGGFHLLYCIALFSFSVLGTTILIRSLVCVCFLITESAAAFNNIVDPGLFQAGLIYKLTCPHGNIIPLTVFLSVMMCRAWKWRLDKSVNRIKPLTIYCRRPKAAPTHVFSASSSLSSAFTDIGDGSYLHVQFQATTSVDNDLARICIPGTAEVRHLIKIVRLHPKARRAAFIPT